MSTEDKISKLLAQILRATYLGTVPWELSAAPLGLTKNTDNFVPTFLRANYKGSVIVVYEERGKHWTDEDSFNWSTSIRFGFIVSGEVITESVRWSPVLGQLYDAAKKHASGVDSIIDNLLD
jgi:hypothetical protein